jgi:hypothetical protein
MLRFVVFDVLLHAYIAVRLLPDVPGGVFGGASSARSWRRPPCSRSR